MRHESIKIGFIEEIRREVEELTIQQELNEHLKKSEYLIIKM
jgi:hypothetical protein|tara:strand:+ start:737 stop:862 length:126 start_codon:yes stop_codon:yes gene_type:complete